VSDSLFEQYKAALRRGHLAALAGNLDEALEAYAMAARLVPERALPIASQGTVLHRLDRWAEAAEAFDLALRLAPDDEATLRARATARDERGLRSGAAADFERLAFVLDVAGRASEAAEAARRAVALESTPARVELLRRLSASAAAVPEMPAPVAPRRATPTTPPSSVDEPERPQDDAEPGSPAADHAGSGSMAAASPAMPHAADVEDESDPSASWPPIDLPSPPPPPIVGPPPDPELLLAEATDLLDAGDPLGARDRMLIAVSVHRTAGRLDAALDVCLLLLTLAPGDPQVHLAIAGLQLDRGWTSLATEKIQLLLRLTALTGDVQAEADAHALAAERLRDESASLAVGATPAR